MTREHKLALILGFSVLLVVGLLVGDHFSKARKPVGAAGGDPAVASAQPGTVSPGRINDPLSLTSAPTPPTNPAMPPSTSGLGGAAAGTLAISDANGATMVEPIIMGTPGAARPAHMAGTDNPLGGGVSPGPGSSSNPSLDDLRRQLERLSQNPGGPATGPGSATVAGVPPAAVTPPPAAHPSAPLLPVSLGKERLHPVEEGETLYAIAKKEYGDGNLWKELAKYNASRVKGESVRAGVTLKIPPKDVLLGKAVLAGSTSGGVRVDDVLRTPSAPTGSTLGSPMAQLSTTGGGAASGEAKTYTVKAGDTLGAIAKATLGSAKRWEEILAVNSDKLESPEELKIGMVLRLPAK